MEIVEKVKNGEGLDCPICMECAEDAVLSPCAHSFCRECILTAWQGKAEGSCPTCRRECSPQERPHHCSPSTRTASSWTCRRTGFDPSRYKHP